MSWLVRLRYAPSFSPCGCLNLRQPLLVVDGVTCASGRRSAGAARLSGAVSGPANAAEGGTLVEMRLNESEAMDCSADTHPGLPPSRMMSLGLPARLVRLSLWAVGPLHEVLDAPPVCTVCDDLKRLILRFVLAVTRYHSRHLPHLNDHRL